MADQQGVTLEHIVQDSCSDDGTQDWLPTDQRVCAVIEKDSGMYDAVNRGWRRATGDILSYINCDEQYLPGALSVVEKFFAKNPDVDVCLGTALVTDGSGNYICHRQALVPHPWYAWLKFNALTSSIFIRRSVINERGIFFDTRWRDLGDFHWVMEMRRRGVRMAVCDEPLSVFADTGENMGLKPNAIRETAETLASVPTWQKVLKPLWTVHHRMRRLFAGHYTLRPMYYDIYTLASPDRRVRFEAKNPTGLWRNRM